MILLIQQPRYVINQKSQIEILVTEKTSPFFKPEPSSRQRCYPTNCGQPNIRNKKLQKIVGGQWAGSAQYWPWQASLR